MADTAIPEPVRPARDVNPHAGNHRVTADPAAIRACESATATSFRRFPYWEARFGERAHAFSASDSGWMVTVAAGDADHARAQIAWLSDVLSARGMPRILMEDHLGVLADELDATRPGDGVPGALRHAADSLRTGRLARVGADATVAIVRRFEAAVAGDSTGVANCAPLIVSAVCDEADLPPSVGALVDWLGDPERFSATWLAAVEQAVEEAYAALA